MANTKIEEDLVTLSESLTTVSSTLSSIAITEETPKDTAEMVVVLSHAAETLNTVVTSPGKAETLNGVEYCQIVTKVCAVTSQCEKLISGLPPEEAAL